MNYVHVAIRKYILPIYYALHDLSLALGQLAKIHLLSRHSNSILTKLHRTHHGSFKYTGIGIVSLIGFLS